MRLGMGRATRRELMRGGMAATAAVVGGSLLAGCASGATTASVTNNQPVTDLRFMPWWVYWNTTGKALLAEAAANFNQTHPGLRLTAVPGPQGGGASTSAVIVDILAGTAPDVVADCCTSWTSYMQVNAFADITPYLKQDNIDIGTWAKAQTAALATDQGQFGIPVYNGPVVCCYRQDTLDDLGLDYPDPQWSYQDAAALWTQCAGRSQVNGKAIQRYGADFLWTATNWYAMEYLLHGFGGAVMDTTRTKALFGEEGSIAAANWVYPLLWQNVLGGGTGSLTDGTAVFAYSGGWNIHSDVTNYHGLKWSYAPMPKWPQGRTTFSNDDYWGLVSTGKNLDKGWEVLKWLTYDDFWQKFCMQATLLAPTRVSLWPEFQTQLEQTAPVLQGKGLEWFVDAAQGGYAYPTEFFRYQTSAAFTLINTALTQINARTVDARTAFTTLSQQIDALEAAGATEEQAATKVGQEFPVTGSPMAKVAQGL